MAKARQRKVLSTKIDGEVFALIAARVSSVVKRALIVPLLVALGSCTHLAIDDCGGKVRGVNEPRIRSSHFRMFLADLPAASARFVEYAAMSSLAYAEDMNCGRKLEDQKISSEKRSMLEGILATKHWQEVRNPAWINPCEDDVGLFFRVWERTVDAKREVVIAFRGTWGVKDWVYGNSHWLTRWLPMDDQYSRARAAAKTILAHYDVPGVVPTRYITTGHSLGGGLAQHILYANPKKVVQTIAFDPSSVTGFADQWVDNQIAGCACDITLPDGEARIYRVYDAYEILANMRFFHKVFFPPERHVQEVRFPHEGSHSMIGLTEYLKDHVHAARVSETPWFQGKGEREPGLSCTDAFINGQKDSCHVPVSKDSRSKCPQ